MDAALENLKLARDILNKLGVEFSLEAGTLLLAYRDGKVDETDVDITVLDIKKVIDNLDKFYQKGFELAAFYNHELAPEITLRRNGVHLDIWTKLFRDGQAWWLSFLPEKPIPHHVDEKHFKSFDTLEIWGEKWNIPHDTERYLQVAYGDWKTPDPNWVWWRDPKCIDYNWEIR